MLKIILLKYDAHFEISLGSWKHHRLQHHKSIILSNIIFDYCVYLKTKLHCLWYYSATCGKPIIFNSTSFDYSADFEIKLDCWCRQRLIHSKSIIFNRALFNSRAHFELSSLLTTSATISSLINQAEEHSILLLRLFEIRFGYWRNHR